MYIWIVKILTPQSCPILCNLTDYIYPSDSSVPGIFQARILEWVSHSLLQGIFLTQRSNLGLLHHRQSLYHLSHQGSQCMCNFISYSLGKIKSCDHTQLWRKLKHVVAGYLVPYKPQSCDYGWRPWLLLDCLLSLSHFHSEMKCC